METRPMSDPSDFPPEHLWITQLIARGMARVDEEAPAFHRGALPDASEADRTLHREYLEEAYEVLRGTGRVDELSLMEKLVQGPAEKPKKKMTIEEVEAWIADREAKVSRIEHHLHIWDRGGFEGRDSSWADRARKAVEFTERQIRFGYNLRLNLTREAPDGTVRALEDRVAAAEAARQREREERAFQVGRHNAETQALKAYLSEHAPHLLEGAFAAYDAAVDAYERARWAAPDAEPEAAEPEPAP
jgi:hypothetical protein